MFKREKKQQTDVIAIKLDESFKQFMEILIESNLINLQ